MSYGNKARLLCVWLLGHKFVLKIFSHKDFGSMVRRNWAMHDNQVLSCFHITSEDYHKALLAWTSVKLKHIVDHGSDHFLVGVVIMRCSFPCLDWEVWWLQFSHLEMNKEWYLPENDILHAIVSKNFRCKWRGLNG